MNTSNQQPEFSISILVPRTGKFRTAITSDQFLLKGGKVDVDFMADVADALVKTGATEEARVYNQKNELEALVNEAYFARD
jgi:hypothetical protein